MSNLSQSLKRSYGPASITIPLKRRKVEHVNGDHESQITPQPHIKRELSPTPPPSLTPRVSGTVCIPFPNECKKSTPDWRESRTKLLLKETEKLQSLGLQVIKRLVRDDGIALDWTSPVPVDPYTLKPSLPSSTTPASAPVELPPPPPPKDLPPPAVIDPLGHALRDQAVTVRQPLQHPAQSPEKSPPLSKLKQPVFISSQSPANPPTKSPNFVVVGAASLKEQARSGDDHSGTNQDAFVKLEHRRLLPAALRPSSHFHYENRARANERKDRRKEWIRKEIEKIEGYTGEKVRGFRYDGDDVIIEINRREFFKRRRRGCEQVSNDQASSPEEQHRIEHDRIELSALEKPQRQAPPPAPKLQPSTAVSSHVIEPKSSKPVVNNEVRDAEVHSNADPVLVPTMPRVMRTSLVRVRDLPPSVTPSPPHFVEKPLNHQVNMPEAISAQTLLASMKLHHDEVGSHPNDDNVTPKTRPKQAGTPKANGSRPAEVSQRTITAEGQRVTQSRGLGFLERYLCLFDSNRDALVSAFTPNATFSLTEAGVRNTSPDQTPMNMTTSSPLSIVQTLKKLGTDLHHSPQVDISYSITPLDDMREGGLLMTCEGALVPVNSSISDFRPPERFFSRIFVLRRNDGDHRDSWPLQVVAEKLFIHSKPN
ncbi:hypothetical protein BU17DRAFT_84871 [Hysterangium stoloniferum]|nr:hypothetical protein BU17DRAFT_84871 [Hysterangium stoloniferum]